jgi:hypothetical protein
MEEEPKANVERRICHHHQFLPPYQGRWTQRRGKDKQPPQPISQETKKPNDINDNDEINQHYQYKMPNRWKWKNVRVCCHKLQQLAAFTKWTMVQQNQKVTGNGNWKSKSNTGNKNGAGYETQKSSAA